MGPAGVKGFDHLGPIMLPVRPHPIHHWMTRVDGARGWLHEAASRVDRFRDTSGLLSTTQLVSTRALSRTCSDCCCSRLSLWLDSFGHHRAAGLLARRGFAVEMAAANVRREAGAPVTTGVPHPALDGRRLEVVAESLPIFGVHLALDTTLVSLVGADGTASAGVRWSVPGASKERTYPEPVMHEWRHLAVSWMDNLSFV